MGMRMKLVFPNGEREQAELRPGDNSVGSSDRADIVLKVNGIAEQHAIINVSERGVLIGVRDATNITRVNGQLVAARTPVKAGDALLFANVQCQVVGENPLGPKQRPAPRAAALDAGQTRVRAAIPTFTLRGVSGKTFGKVYPVHGSAVIGRHSDCDICLPLEEISRHHARIELTAEGLYVEDMGSANGTFVNGNKVRRAKLNPGDELMLDTVRFLLQSPGAEAARKVAKKPAGATTKPPPSTAAPARRGSPVVKWFVILTLLIAAAAAGLKFGGIL